MSVTGQVYFLGVAINGYQSPELNPLQFAVRDVEAIRDLLRERLGLTAERSLVLTHPPDGSGALPTRVEILKAFARCADAPMTAHDTLIVYVAAHAFADSEDETYLLAMDSEPGAGLLRHTALPLKSLRGLLRGSAVGQQIWFLDICRNTPLALTRELGRDHMTEAVARDVRVLATLPSDAAAPVASSRGKAVVSACWEGQRSFEYPAGRHSWFCHHLLPCLRAQPAGTFKLNQAFVQAIAERMAQEAWLKLPAASHQRPRLLLDGEEIQLELRSPAVPDKTTIPAPLSPPQSEPPRAPMARPADAVSLTGEPRDRDRAGVNKTRAWRRVMLGMGAGALGGVVLILALMSKGTARQPPRFTIAPPPSDQRAWTNRLGQVFLPGVGTNLWFAQGETRVRDYATFTRQTRRAWRPPAFPQEPDHPAVNVSWEEAAAFCDWLTDQERTEGRLRPHDRYRLPTDREWSAAVGLPVEPGATPADRHLAVRDVYPWNGPWPPPPGAGNYGTALGVDPHAGTAPVTFAPGRLGLCGLSGNVREWCADGFDATTRFRVVRGASWRNTNSDYLLASYRGNELPHHQADDLGFRLVLEQGEP